MVPSDAQPKVEPGWYPDPQKEGSQSYWDGSDWTTRTRPDRPHGPVNRLAVTGFICALVGIPGAGILGIVLGVLALDEIEDSNGTQRGQGLAKWSIFLGFVWLVLVAIVVLLLVAGSR